ncbi:hypothetical protein FI667_g14364, partial [Globisporangium splendens]
MTPPRRPQQASQGVGILCTASCLLLAAWIVLGGAAGHAPSHPADFVLGGRLEARLPFHRQVVGLLPHTEEERASVKQDEPVRVPDNSSEPRIEITFPRNHSWWQTPPDGPTLKLLHMHFVTRNFNIPRDGWDDNPVDPGSVVAMTVLHVEVVMPQQNLHPEWRHALQTEDTKPMAFVNLPSAGHRNTKDNHNITSRARSTISVCFVAGTIGPIDGQKKMWLQIMDALRHPGHRTDVGDSTFAFQMKSFVGFHIDANTPTARALKTLNVSLSGTLLSIPVDDVRRYNITSQRHLAKILLKMFYDAFPHARSSFSSISPTDYAKLHTIRAEFAVSYWQNMTRELQSCRDGVLVLGNARSAGDTTVVLAARMAGVKSTIMELTNLYPEPVEVDILLGPSRYAAAHPSVAGVVRFKRSYVLSTGVDTNTFAPATSPSGSNARSKISDREPRFTIGYIDRLAADKSVGITIATAKLMKEVCQHCHFRIIGDGPLKEHLEIPRDPWNCCVGGDEHWRTRVGFCNSIAVNEPTPGGFRHALMSPVQNPELKREMGANAQKTVLDLFSLHKCFAKYAALYQRCICSVEISEDARVSDLKRNVKETMPRRVEHGAEELKLYLAKNADGGWFQSRGVDVKKLKAREITGTIKAQMNLPDEGERNDGEIQVLVELPPDQQWTSLSIDFLERDLPAKTGVDVSVLAGWNAELVPPQLDLLARLFKSGSDPCADMFNRVIRNVLKFMFSSAFSGRADRTGSKCLDYFFGLNAVCAFRGEEAHGDEALAGLGTLRRKLCDKSSWSYGDMPYLLGYSAAGYNVCLHALVHRGHSRIDSVPLTSFDLNDLAERFHMLLALLNLPRLFESLAEICPASGQDEYMDIRRDDLLMRLNPTEVEKSFFERSTFEVPAHHLQQVYAVLREHEVPNVDLHGAGWMHRDVQWSNVIKRRGDSSGSWFLIDFEDSAPSPQDSRRGCNLSKEEHAPEIFAGSGAYTTVADI